MNHKEQTRQLVDRLRLHYTPPSRSGNGLWMEEVQSPEHHRRADALWVPYKRYRENPYIVGHEVKVSRSDVVKELQDVTKSEAWGKFCRYWYLVIPDVSIIEGLVIPQHWGIIVPPKSDRRYRFQVVRPAEERTVMQEEVGFARLLFAFKSRFEEDYFSVSRKLMGLEREKQYLEERLRSAGELNYGDRAVLDRVLKVLSDCGVSTTSFLQRGSVYSETISNALKEGDNIIALREAERSLQDTARILGARIESLQKSVATIIDTNLS